MAYSKWHAGRSVVQNTKFADGSRIGPGWLKIAPMRRYPLSFIVLSTLGVLCAIPGAISLAGFGASLHPILDDPMAGLAFIVSAIALLGSGAFPLVIEKLRENEGA
jgi:hypothetical protein